MAGIEGYKRPGRYEAAFNAGNPGGAGEQRRGIVPAGGEIALNHTPKQDVEGKRSLHTRYDWKEELDYFLGREGSAPGGKAFPDRPLWYIQNTIGQAKRAGDPLAEQDLNLLEDAYVFSTFPFLSDAQKLTMTRAYYEGGWLRPQEREDHQVIVLNDELYPYHTQLLEKANIPELYQLSGQGEVPHRLTKKTGRHAVPIQPVLTQMRQVADEEGFDWRHSPPPAK